jgi:hypothetical protein
MANRNKQTRRKKSAKKTTPKRKARKGAVSKRSSLARNKKFSAKRKRLTTTGVVVETASLPSGEQLERRDGQSGDFQGISNRPMASSESVEELLEEGNPLEAEAVQAVENAPDADQGEVEIHKAPKHDVPEYLDKDR